MPTPPVRALLFDLGGVLVDIDFRRALNAWAHSSALTAEGLGQAFRFDQEYERHERGEMTAAEYFEHLASALRLSRGAVAAKEGWNSIFVGELSETRRMVEIARKTVPCFAFTNTNATHMEAWSALFPEVVAAFDQIFASHEIGLRKPELAAFEHVCQCIGVASEHVLFFDDLNENVAAAREAGLQSVLVRSPTDVRTTLRGLGHAL